jgi:hypothetical protein
LFFSLSQWFHYYFLLELKSAPPYLSKGQHTPVDFSGEHVGKIFDRTGSFVPQ